MTNRFSAVIILLLFAPVAELADALDLGSSVPDVKVQVLSGAPYRVFLQNLNGSERHSVFYCLNHQYSGYASLLPSALMIFLLFFLVVLKIPCSTDIFLERPLMLDVKIFLTD